MMNRVPLQLSLAPLSAREIDLALGAVARLQLPLLRAMRQPHPQGCLLRLELEVDLGSDTPRWYAERVVAHLWHALGRFVRASCWLEGQGDADESVWLDFDEGDYRSLLPAFRLTRRL